MAEDIQRMVSTEHLEHRDSSKRDISLRHLCVIYCLLALSIALGMLSLVLLDHLNRRQMNVEMKLGISSSSSKTIYFDAHQSVKDKAREFPSESEYQVEELLEEDDYERQAQRSNAESGYAAASSLGLPESDQGHLSGAVRHRSSRNTNSSNSVPSLENPEDSRLSNSTDASFEHQAPEETLVSVPNGLSSISEPSTTNPNERGHRTRISREIRDIEGDAETITVRAQDNKKKGRTPRNRPAKQQQKHENESRLQGMTAIHLHARPEMERQYESGPMVSLNASHTKDNVYRFWRKASWVPDSVDSVFHLDETTGHVTVEIEGLYMVYAQMVYHDLSGRWSFGIYVGHQEKVKCLATEQLRDLQSYHPTSHGVYQSCYTAIVLHIRKNQSVTIRCMYGSRTILTRPEFTFWGMVRLS